MSLAPGTRLGAYEVLSLLGAGGMGEVYRARDTRLRRDVAIKVLPETFAKDDDRLARFQREAELLAALNHQNIGAVFGLEQDADRRAIVLELIEGDTLADRIHRGPLSIEAALKIARQIAEALEAAHERGVIHRDLKPANIKITSDDKVKVLDFGLAKALELNAASATADGSLSHSPTLSMVATQAGVILGTAAYMSPEQANGRPADQRSDIFAFGTVLYEMLTGRQPFHGTTAPEILASVLVREADLSALPANLNPRIRELVERCLEKNPKDRWQAIGDVRAEIDRVALSPRSIPVAALGAQRPLWKRALTTGAAVLAGAALAGTAVWLSRPGAPRHVAKFSFMLPEGQSFTNVGRQVIAMSPDGTRFVYVANRQLFLRSLSDLEATPIAGTSGQAVMNPVFSPDGESIAFWMDGNLKRIAISGGAAVTIAAMDGPYGMSWPDDTIFVGQGTKGIARVPASSGKPETVVAAAPDQFLHSPQLLPDRRTLLFTVGDMKAADRWATSQIVAQTLETGARKTLIAGGTAACYIPGGYLSYTLGSVVRVVPFNAKTLEVSGSPTPVVLDALTIGLNTGAAHLSFSNTGIAAYLRGGLRDLTGKLAYRSADGQKIEPITEESANFPRYPRVSPDGRRLAVTIGPPNQGDIWIYELGGGRQPLNVTFDDGHDTMPVWSPDGRRIFYFSALRSGLGGGIFSVAADGSESVPKRLPLSESVGVNFPMEFAPDGLLMVASGRTQMDGFGLGGLYLIPVGDETSKVEPRSWLDTEFREDEARFSPNGRLVAYTSNSSGRPEIWVRPYPGPGAPVRVSTGGGHEPVWSHDGKRIFFQNGARIMAVTLEGAPGDVRFSSPTELFAGGFFSWEPTTRRTYDVLPDGRFLMVQTMDQREPRPEIAVVMNWFEELKRLAPPR
jgi:Tol biopolymer transport system component